MNRILKKTLSSAIAVMMILCAVLGSISPAAVSSKKPGDINGDNEVDNKDVVSLFRYLSGMMDASLVDLVACDVNGDGNSDNKDVAVLFRYLNGADIEIFYGKDEPQPELDNVYRVWNDDTLKAFGLTKQTTVSLEDGCVCFKYKRPATGIDPYVIFNIAKYAELTGKPALTGKDGSFIVIKAKSNSDGYMEVFTHSPASGDTSSVTYKTDGEFHYMIIDMTDTTFTSPEKLSTVRFDWAGAAAEDGCTAVISEIGFFSGLDEALEYTKLTKDEVYKENAGALTFPQDKEASEFVKSPSITVTNGSDGKTRTAVIKSAKKSPAVNVDLRALAELDNKCVKKNSYVAIRLRVTNQTGLKIALSNVVDISGLSKLIAQTSTVDCASDGWQGVMFNIRDSEFYEYEIASLRMSFTNYNPEGTVEFGGFVVSDNINDALSLCGHPEYCLNYDSSLTDNDELADKVLTAENEDGTLKLWFDQTTQKTYRNNTESTGKTGYTVRMAKNEVENCQFFIAPEKALKARVEIDPFKNAKGDTLEFEAFYEFYHNIKNIMIPDALPPLTGAIDIAAGNSQGYVLQFTTKPSTPAGTYESVVHVYDDATGKEIKRAAVAVKVWDFELSEKTELRTAFALWGSYVLDSYNWNNVSFSDVEVMDNYYEFFLKYRINIMDNPHGLTSSYAAKFMNMDRVNTARWGNMDMSVTEDNGGVRPVWMDKVIYYPGELDEPRTNNQFSLFKPYTDRIKSNTPDYRMVIPTDRNLNMKADGTIASSFEESDMDQVEFMSQYVNIWCPKLDAFTPRDLGFISRTSFVQSEEQDAKYGSFTDRMKKEVAEGDELWAYICINPTEPYANWQLLSDGTETIVSAWQMKEYGITGMLYWAVNYWRVSYWNQSTPWTGSGYGDGMLIYSGYAFGLPTPISSLRLENIRDGIEDYQMLCMLEDVLGEEAAKDMISRITTSVVTYANNDDYIHAVRVLLGDTLEAALAH